jgi:hypothetical protein
VQSLADCSRYSPRFDDLQRQNVGENFSHNIYVISVIERHLFNITQIPPQRYQNRVIAFFPSVNVTMSFLLTNDPAPDPSHDHKTHSRSSPKRRASPQLFRVITLMDGSMHPGEAEHMSMIFSYLESAQLSRKRTTMRDPSADGYC